MSQLALYQLIQVNPEDYNSKKNKQLKDYTTPNNFFGHREGNTECCGNSHKVTVDIPNKSYTYIIALGLKERQGTYRVIQSIQSGFLDIFLLKTSEVKLARC